MMRSPNLYKVARARSVDHRCLFQAMGMRQRPQIGHVGTFGEDCEPWGYVTLFFLATLDSCRTCATHLLKFLGLKKPMLRKADYHLCLGLTYLISMTPLFTIPYYLPHDFSSLASEQCGNSSQSSVESMQVGLPVVQVNPPSRHFQSP